MFLRQVEKECLKLECLCLCSLLDFTQLSRDKICFDCSLTELFWVLCHLNICQVGTVCAYPSCLYLNSWIFLSIMIVLLFFYVSTLWMQFYRFVEQIEMCMTENFHVFLILFFFSLFFFLFLLYSLSVLWSLHFSSSRSGNLSKCNSNQLYISCFCGDDLLPTFFQCWAVD